MQPLRIERVDVHAETNGKTNGNGNGKGRKAKAANGTAAVAETLSELAEVVGK
jgi:hypothetical protein